MHSIIRRSTAVQRVQLTLERFAIDRRMLGRFPNHIRGGGPDSTQLVLYNPAPAAHRPAHRPPKLEGLVCGLGLGRLGLGRLSRRRRGSRHLEKVGNLGSRGRLRLRLRRLRLGLRRVSHRRHPRKHRVRHQRSHRVGGGGGRSGRRGRRRRGTHGSRERGHRRGVRVGVKHRSRRRGQLGALNRRPHSLERPAGLERVERERCRLRALRDRVAAAAAAGDALQQAGDARGPVPDRIRALPRRRPGRLPV
mmetsp:Transcript_12327/g.57045  ORF Transcript_12327/g.57045 Transcript_12327/m.57045 type:complete len:250 (+) Transcript_12327:212-961(+)